MRERFVVGLDELDGTQVALAGGKGAQLGELTRVDGVDVPPGFCVTTEAFRRVVAPAIGDRLARLSHVDTADRDGIAALSGELRQVIEEAPVPAGLAAAITGAVGDAAYAVRSSATAEDLPTASFAGQQDTYLNIAGADEVLRHVRRCWASLFTERAVTYRRRAGIDDRTVHMAVVAQELVVPRAAGILFTADPVTSDRTVASVEASVGLGEALVSGLVSPDVYAVRDDTVISRSVGAKKLAIEPAAGGGTRQLEVDPGLRDRPVLTDAEVVALVRLGRRIEAHFGRPQDIEWCLADGGFRIVQSRPITTLFPVPETGDAEHHVYLSVGHQQMMTDPMRPLGLSFWQLTTPAPMAEAGGRLFVDVTQRLAAPAGRAALLDMIGTGDPLAGDALRTVLDRDFVTPLPDQGPPGPLPSAGPTPIETDPAIVTELIGISQASVAACAREIATKSGAALLDFIRADLPELRRLLFDRRSSQVFLSAMDAAVRLNDRLLDRLGERNAADTLTRSVPHNVTSEMGLALLDVADAIRPHPELVSYLDGAGDDDGFLDRLAGLPGGREARAAVEGWLEKYGMRCAGEIDITRPRWSEHPATLVPVLLGNVRNVEPGEGPRRFQQGLAEARAKEQDVLAPLRALPDGSATAAETKEMIDRVRTYIGYREYPKYAMVCRYFLYKQALLAEADRLVEAGALADREDLYYLRFDELRDVVVTKQAPAELIRERREAYRAYESLTPPRVLTSDGEALTGAYRRDDLPPGALAGLPVSAGTVEGRARVVLDIAAADLEPGDILVTAYTDPSWTPLFVTVAGLVTEVGGLMTHGAVIAREYGLPAVVGVPGATHLIPDGARIRLHGTDGYLEILP